MATTPQVQLPAGYEDATPITGQTTSQPAQTSSSVSLPAGYEDATAIAGPNASTDHNILGKMAQVSSDLDTGIVKGVGDTVSGVAHLINKIPVVGETLAPSQGISALDKMDVSNGVSEAAGKGIEGITEFVAGDELLEGLSKGTKLVALARKYPIIEDTLALAAKHPFLAKLITGAGHGAVVGGAEGAIKGAQHNQAVEGMKTGAEIGGTAGAVAPIVGALANKAGEAIADTAGKVSDFTKSIVSGEKVAQPVAQDAIRSGVQTAAENAGTANESLTANVQNQPLIGRASTILDEHLSSLRGLEQDAYDRIDEAAGFDVKAEKAQLANDQYKLKQLGNTDVDLAQKEKLNASIADSQSRIADAQAKMQDADVDPKEADGLHAQRMAGADLRKVLVQNTSSDGQTVNVDGLLNAAKKLQFAKYGNRLTQFFGSPEAADSFVSGLEDAQKAGIHAAKVQNLAKWIGGITASAAGVAGAGALGAKTIEVLNER